MTDAAAAKSKHSVPGKLLHMVFMNIVITVAVMAAGHAIFYAYGLMQYP